MAAQQPALGHVVWFTQRSSSAPPGCSGTAARRCIFDIAHLHLFGLVLWPQDALLLAIVLAASHRAFTEDAPRWRGGCSAVLPVRRRSTSIFMWIGRVEGIPTWPA